MATATTRKTIKTLDRVTLNYLSKAYYSLKTASTEIIGTNKKPDVLRVLRTQGLLEYSETGMEHQIQDAGYRYFVSDTDRRQTSGGLVPQAKLPDVWKVKPGTEVFITGRNALELKRDHFDGRIMSIIDPPRAARINGLRMEQLLPLLDNPELEDAVDIEEEPLTDAQDYWTAHRVKLAAVGNEAAARALDYLTARRTKVFINELAQRAGIDLENLERMEQHLHTFCSFRMRLMLEGEVIFANRKMLNKYLSEVGEATFEAVYGYSPELVTA